MLSDNPRRFADTVKQTFQGRTMQARPFAPLSVARLWLTRVPAGRAERVHRPSQVAGQRFTFPKFE